MGFPDLLLSLWRRKLAALSCLATALAVGGLVSSLLPVRYRSVALLQIESTERNVLSGYLERRLKTAEAVAQQAAVVDSQTVARQVVDTLVAEGALTLDAYAPKWREETGGEILPGNDLSLWVADALRENLTVEADGAAGVISIGYLAETPSAAARLANAFADAYTRTTVDARAGRFAVKAAKFEEESRVLAEDAAAAQRDLAEFRRKADLVPIGEQGAEAVEIDLAALTRRLSEARADAAEARSLLAEAKAAAPAALAQLPLPVGATAAVNAQIELARIEAQIAALAEIYAPDYPDYADALRQRSALRARIAGAIRDHARVAEARVVALEAGMAKLKTAAAEAREDREAYALLDDWAGATRAAFRQAAARTLEEELQARIGAVDVTPLSRALPSLTPAGLPAWATLTVSGVVGFFLGAGLAVLLEFVDARARSDMVVAQALRAPVLGAVVAARPTRGARRSRQGWPPAARRAVA